MCVFILSIFSLFSSLYFSFLSKLENIMIITSDICGLGKSEKIKKAIEDSKKEYFHFPLGGILTKDVIFKKLDNLLKEIKKKKL